MNLTQRSVAPRRPVELNRCPLAWAHELMGGKWKQPIVWWLSREPRTFLSLKRRLPGISAKVLSELLRELAHDGIVIRTEEYRGRVRQVRYNLTDSGRALVPTLDAFCRWAAAHVSKSPN